MNAAMLLAKAKAAGVTVEADGNRLRLTSATPPPIALMHDLAGAKAELLALLECQGDEAAECSAWKERTTPTAQHVLARDQRE